MFQGHVKHSLNRFLYFCIIHPIHSNPGNQSNPRLCVSAVGIQHQRTACIRLADVAWRHPRPDAMALSVRGARVRSIPCSPWPSGAELGRHQRLRKRRRRKACGRPSNLEVADLAVVLGTRVTSQATPPQRIFPETGFTQFTPPTSRPTSASAPRPNWARRASSAARKGLQKSAW